jgi:energy-coupling factor transporter ATP-binding protein EcfA2
MTNHHLPTKNYYDVGYDSFPTLNYYYDTFGVFPSQFYFGQQKFEVGVIDLFVELGFEIVNQKKGNKPDPHYYDTTLLDSSRTTKLMISIVGHVQQNDKIDYRVRIYHPQGADIKDLIAKVENCGHIKTKQGNISLLRATQYGLEAVDFDVQSEITDLELSYGPEFLPIHNKILEALSKDKSKGIVLLDGDPGTGKSYYLKHLSTLLKKRVLWLPQTAADALCNPDFVTFLMENTNSILIIEDAERVVKERMTGDVSANAVANLLNITDGILSDCLHVQVIATFNTNRSNIDKALRRKGRLIAEHTFKKLSVEQTNLMLKHLNIDHVSDKELTLADIYNFNDNIGIADIKERTKIAFR